MAVELRLREQLLNSTIRIDKRSQYYGAADVVPVVALRMLYELLAEDTCGAISLEYETRKKIESLANEIIIKNKDICKLRGSKTPYFKDAQGNLPVLTTALIGPTVDSNSKVSNDGLDETSFDVDDFSKDFSGDDVSLLKIVTLPPYGTLQYNGVDVTAGQIIELSDIENLIYTRIDDALYEDSFFFRTSNNETYKTFSNMATFTVNIDAEPNSIPEVEDTSTTAEYGETITFTEDMFTDVFSDADGDDPSQVMFTTLTTVGSLQLNGVDITLNQIVDLTDIALGLLTYVPDASETDAQSLDFTFEMSDTAGEFSGSESV